jgi:hypothetical protein
MRLLLFRCRMVLLLALIAPHALAAKLDLAFNSIEAIKVRAARTTILG